MLHTLIEQHYKYYHINKNNDLHKNPKQKPIIMDDGNTIAPKAQKGVEETHFELWDFVKTLDFLFQYNTVKKISQNIP